MKSQVLHFHLRRKNGFKPQLSKNLSGESGKQIADFSQFNSIFVFEGQFDDTTKEGCIWLSDSELPKIFPGQPKM